MKNRKNRKKRKYFHLTLNEIVIFVLIGLALILLFPFIFTKFSIGISYDNIGDTIGGISAPFLSFFGSILVYLALKSQVKANKDVQKQFKKQELKDYTQNFENIFFNLLTIHHQIVENIDFNANDILDDNDLSLYFSRYHLTLIDDIKKNNDLKSRDVFKFSFKVLRQLYLISFENHKDYDSDGRKNTYLFCPKSRITFENITEEVYLQGMYDKIYFKLNTDLGHYFRNLYQIIKRVDVANFSDDYLQDYKIKYSYTSIIRAQLSDDEVKWLFFNCLTDMGFEKFKPLLEKYSLLKIIYKNDEVFNPFVKYYKPSAFENPMEDPQIINHLKINFHDKGYLIKTSPNPNIKFTVVDNND